LHLRFELAHEQGQVERLRQARAKDAAFLRQVGNRLEQLLHPQGRLYRDPHDRGFVSGVSELVDVPRRNHDSVAGSGDDSSQAFLNFIVPLRTSKRSC
jgi:hypothetical protein